MVNYEHYTYRVIWAEEDAEFVGLCTEFPSLSYLDDTHLKSLEVIINLVKDIVTDMEANGEKILVPNFREKV